MLAQLKDEFSQDLQVVYRHFPLLSIHDKAALAAQAAEAAGNQGQFWPMHDLLYEQQAEWAATSVEGFQNWLLLKATELRLDIDQFTTDLEAADNAAMVQATWEFGQEAGIPGTPYLLINGNPYGGPLDYGNLRTIIKLLLLQERHYEACPPLDIDPLKDYIATLETEKGPVVIQLFADQAPLAVNSFVFLAHEGWFDGVTFHRVLPGFVAQTGDPTGTGFGGPGYAFDNEVIPELRFDRKGLVALANAGPGSNGSQFFITYGPQPDLDGSFTIFGEVLSGMEIIDGLTPRNPAQNPNLPEGDVILKVTVEER